MGKNTLLLSLLILDVISLAFPLVDSRFVSTVRGFVAHLATHITISAEACNV